MQKKWSISDDFGLRSPVIQKPFLQTKNATSIVARAQNIYFEVLRVEGQTRHTKDNPKLAPPTLSTRRVANRKNLTRAHSWDTDGGV